MIEDWKKMFPCLMSLDLCCDIWMVRPDLNINSMKGCIPSFLGSIIQGAAAGVIVWGLFSWHTFDPLVSIEHDFRQQPTWVSLLTVSIPLWPVYPSSYCCFQQDNTPCLKAEIITNCYLELDNELTFTLYTLTLRYKLCYLFKLFLFLCCV